jgi:hypothetical protein
MNWRVIWTPAAQQALASYWVKYPKFRNELTDVTNRIDELLERDPLACGESRSPNRRIMFEPPYAVSFFVDEAARIVHVFEIWRYYARL